jgi:hypothetical protein
MKKPLLKRVPAGKPLPVPKIKISPEELQEFHLRRTTLNTAKFQALMVEEAYALWAKNLRIKYDIPTVKYEIDPQTGVVTPQEERHG